VDRQRAYDEALTRLFEDLPEEWVGAAASVDLASEFPYRFVAPDGSWHERDVPDVDDPELAAVELVDRLQDDVIETWQLAWPRCSTHQHPMVPRLLERIAVWVCPVGDAEPVRLTT
jgi:hypothetical protein